MKNLSLVFRSLALPVLLLTLNAAGAQEKQPLRYVDAATLTVIGKALPTEQPYNRIDTTRFRVPAKTPGYCYHPTGLAVVFRTDSRTIRARWETSGKNPSDNMAAVAQKGLDLYIRSNGEWVFAGVGRPKINGKNDLHDAAIISNMAEGEKESAILRADAEKQSAILRAQGQPRRAHAVQAAHRPLIL